jgi:hypothetical protein
MRYDIHFDKVVNQLVPHYLGGRKLILYLQSTLAPLQPLNVSFAEWARETRIEASMTSQVFKLEWFLNRKFKPYFLDSRQTITIRNGAETGLPIYFQSADIVKGDNVLLYGEEEGKKKSAVLHHRHEKLDKNTFSFLVHSPDIDTSLISREAYLGMLSHYIDKYRIAGKTYKIKFSD